MKSTSIGLVGMARLITQRRINDKLSVNVRYRKPIK
jgi:hypothetical protein